MKIAVIAPSYLPARRANTIQTMKMAQAFAQIGHAVRVFVPGRDPKLSWEELASHYGLESQFEIRWLPTLPFARRYDFGLSSVIAARQWDADLIFTRQPQAATFASRFGVPTVLEVHDLPQGRGQRLFRQFLRGRGARGLISITAALLADIKKEFGIIDDTFAQVLPDGVDLARFIDLPNPKQSRQKLNLPEKFTVGYSGHLYPGRGIELILKIASKMAQVNFLLVGGNPEDVERVHQQAGDNITLTGFVHNAELPIYQAACEVLLMPYQPQVAASSGGDIGKYLSPMKMFEYLASRRVILASDLPVLQEVLLDGENALVLPANDDQAWVATIEKIQLDESLRKQLGNNAQKTAKNYSWQMRAEKILSGLR